MTATLYLLISSAAGYVLGAFPAGYLLVKATRKIDLREIGSGRTGGTNSFRAAGALVGIITSVLDVLKAACAVWLVRDLFPSSLSTSFMPWSEVAAAVSSVIGHNWSIFLGFKGGAGTGPNVGWAGAVWFPIVPIALVVVLGILLTLGMASVASLAMAAAVPLAFAALYLLGVEPYDATVAYLAGGLVTAVIVAWALRPNIQRLVEGRERIIGPRAKRLERRRMGTKQDPGSLRP
jgi:acyl phosphate:glycerol-3-phosphate acyltransferase